MLNKSFFLFVFKSYWPQTFEQWSTFRLPFKTTSVGLMPQMNKLINIMNKKLSTVDAVTRSNTSKTLHTHTHTLKRKKTPTKVECFRVRTCPLWDKRSSTWLVCYIASLCLFSWFYFFDEVGRKEPRLPIHASAPPALLNLKNT